MKTLADFVSTQWGTSVKAYGQQRAISAAIADLRMALRDAENSPQEMYPWVDVIIAATEAALRSGTTSFAVAQALLNRQNEQAAKKWPPALAQQHVQPETP